MQKAKLSVFFTLDYNFYLPINGLPAWKFFWKLVVFGLITCFCGYSSLNFFWDVIFNFVRICQNAIKKSSNEFPKAFSVCLGWQFWINTIIHFFACVFIRFMISFYGYWSLNFSSNVVFNFVSVGKYVDPMSCQRHLVYVLFDNFG